MELAGVVLNLAYAVILMIMLLDFEIHSKRQLIIPSLILILMIALDAFIWLTFGYKAFMLLYPLLIHLPMYFAFWFVSKYKGVKLLFVLLTVIFLSFPPILVGSIVSSFYNNSSLVQIFVGFAMYFPILGSVQLFFRPFSSYMLRNSQNGWLGFCSIPLSYYVLNYSIGKYDMDVLRFQTDYLADVIACVLVTCAYVIILRSFKQTRERLVLQNQQEVLQTGISAAAARLEDIKESQEKAILYRHDLHHHLRLIDAFLTNGEVDKAKEYIAEIEKSIEASVVEKFCDNHTVNLILSASIQKARAEGIQVESRIYVPKEIRMRDMDLCVILANATENAINACVKIPDLALRTISITIREKQEKLLIQISNPFIGTVIFEDERPISPIKHHGIGTRSIISMVEKYNGIYSYTAEKNIFIVTIII